MELIAFEFGCGEGSDNPRWCDPRRSERDQFPIRDEDMANYRSVMSGQHPDRSLYPLEDDDDGDWDLKPVEELMSHENVSKANLQVYHVVALRMYTTVSQGM